MLVAITVGIVFVPCFFVQVSKIAKFNIPKPRFSGKIISAAKRLRKKK